MCFTGGKESETHLPIIWGEVSFSSITMWRAPIGMSNIFSIPYKTKRHSVVQLGALNSKNLFWAVITANYFWIKTWWQKVWSFVWWQCGSNAEDWEDLLIRDFELKRWQPSHIIAQLKQSCWFQHWPVHTVDNYHSFWASWWAWASRCDNGSCPPRTLRICPLACMNRPLCRSPHAVKEEETE